MTLVFVTFILVFGLTTLSAQTIQGVVLDAKTMEPLPFVNIGVVGKGLGTVSNENGAFSLLADLTRMEETDMLQISSLGYATLELSLSECYTKLNSDSKVLLEPSEIQLEEVVLSGAALVPISENLGYRNYGEPIYGYWKDDTALGGQLATKIRARAGKRQLNSLEFEVWENPSDSLLIRINIYDTDGFLGAPKTNLNTSQKNILTTLKKGKTIKTIDLNPYEIFVSDDFFVSLELLQVYGDTPLGLVLAASENDEGSYKTYASQDTWKKISDTNMAYYVETSPYVTQKKARKYESKVERVKQKIPTVSGYAIVNGIMLSDVQVRNSRTKELAVTDEKGRYAIPAKKNDVLIFSKKGYKKMFLEVGEQNFANAIMKIDSAVK